MKNNNKTIIQLQFQSKFQQNTILIQIPVKRKYSMKRKINQVYICEQNLINGKQYIGSAIDLPNRLSFYYSTKAMENYLKIVKV